MKEEEKEVKEGNKEKDKVTREMDVKGCEEKGEDKWKCEVEMETKKAFENKEKEDNIKIITRKRRGEELNVKQKKEG